MKMLMDTLAAVSMTVGRGPAARAVADAPPGLVSYHAAIRALVGRVPAGDRPAITRFLTAAAEAAAGAADDLAP